MIPTAPMVLPPLPVIVGRVRMRIVPMAVEATLPKRGADISEQEELIGHPVRGLQAEALHRQPQGGR